MPWQIHPANDMIRTFILAFPTGFAFSGIKLNMFCVGRFTVEKFWFHCVIVFKQKCLKRSILTITIVKK